MTGAINSINTGIYSSASPNPFGNVQRLTDDTKTKLETQGIDTKNIKTEAQGQTALAQSGQTQQAQQQPQSGEKSQATNGKVEIEALKAQATDLAGKIGIQVPSNAKLSEIVAAIGPVLDSKISAAGTDKNKIVEVQELQAEYDTISSSLSNIQAERQQSKQGSQTLNASLSNMAILNMVFHQL